MKHPTIDQAKRHATEMGARGVVMLAFSDDRIYGVSYGKTKDDCNAMREVLDELVDLMLAGEIEVSW